MASRDISGTLLRVCFGAVRKETTLSKLLGWTLEEMASAQRDLDMTGDVDSAFYYAGLVDAFDMVAQWIAPIKDEKKYFALLGKMTPEEAQAQISKIKEENAA